MNTQPPATDKRDFGAAAIIALGSNMPGRFASPEQAVTRAMAELRRLSERPPLYSSLYRTTPRDCAPGTPDFINAAAVLWPSPELTPETLLTEILRIETKFGRRRGKAPNAPRTLDLDLIAWGTKTARSASLQLPHPRLTERDFVLAPVAELAPNWVPPGQSTSVSTLLKALPDTCIVRNPSIRASIAPRDKSFSGLA